jgi:pimeloyl-ACP methyl ester carboxylesterase
MPSILTSDGVRLDYTDAGPSSGRAVVLIAGFKAAAASWLFQIPALVAAGYRVLALDMRGHGTSQKPAFGHSMSRRAEDLNDFLEALALHDVSLVGGSMGGNTVWAYVSQFGAASLRSIVIVDQTPKMLNSPDWPFGFYGYDESTRDTLFAESIPDTGHGTPLARRGMRLVRLLRAMAAGPKTRGGTGKALDAGELELLNDHARADWREAVATTEVPVLFVAGAESEFWPAGHAAASAALNPLASSAVILNDGHAANMEQPKAFNRGLLAFLATH